MGKLFYLIKADYLILIHALRFKPDIFLSFVSPYAAQVSFLLRKTHIAFDDTEHATLGRLLYKPFTNMILTPLSFNKDLGKKQIRFNGYMELCYLHPNNFAPDPSILDLLGVTKDEKYVIIRFVSWFATHDVGKRGLSLEMKRKTLKELCNYTKIFISSEGRLPVDLQKFQIKISPEKMHDALYYASLYFGESGTMATEAALLGTPSILYLDMEIPGVHRELQKSNILEVTNNINEGLTTAKKILSNVASKEKQASKLKEFYKNTTDVNQFMINTIINYRKR